MTERDVNAVQVREEHLAEVHVGAHWLYLVAVPALGLILMLVLLALLDAT
jgi:hypothetical protein